MKYLKLDNLEISIAIADISKKIIESNYQPDVLISIGRGGMVLTRYLSDILGVKEIGYLPISMYTGVKTRNKMCIRDRYLSTEEIAQSLNLCPVKTEKIVSFLAKITAYLLRQGKMNQENIDENSVNQEQLKMGIKVEKEHIECPVIARKIALDHLAEIPDYYTRLERMEKNAGIEH